jgi:isoquinoline 1-oxidoreductase beta subunit
LGKGYTLGDTRIPQLLVGSVDGVLLQLSQAMHLQITGGSLSVRATGVYGLRVAGAAAREMLKEAAAEAWGVSVGDIMTSNATLYHQASGKQAPYSAFAAAAGGKTPPSAPKLKSPEQFTHMGQNRPRLDIPSKVDGSAIFGIDVVVEGMKYAAISAAPVFGAKVKRFNADIAAQMPGVIEIINLDDAIAVVADGYWLAKQALSKVEISWSETGDDSVSSEALFARFQADLDSASANDGGKKDRLQGDSRTAFAESSRIIEREYRVPYLAHACMEPMNAVAHVRDGRCDIWTGSQNPLAFKYDIADALGIDAALVTVTNHTMGGGFGRRARPDAVIQAARISQAAKRPVKLIWSREEDIQHDYYRPAVVSRFRASLDQWGMPRAWENCYVNKHEPVEAPLIPYAIDHQDIRSVESHSHVPFGPWRSVDHSQHGFFTESFIDELAHETNQDPYRFRKALLKDHPRHQAVLDLAAKQANWDLPLGKNRGRGIALQESFGSIVAEVVEVSVIEGRVAVDKVVVAIDPGFAVSPDGLTAQMESGVIFGLTAALFGEISIENGRVVQSNFHDYPMVRMDSAPAIETHIINSHATWGGAGEPATPAIAPALTNALYAATGKRIRSLPIGLQLKG